MQSISLFAPSLKAAHCYNIKNVVLPSQSGKHLTCWLETSDDLFAPRKSEFLGLDIWHRSHDLDSRSRTWSRSIEGNRGNFRKSKLSDVDDVGQSSDDTQTRNKKMSSYAKTNLIYDYRSCFCIKKIETFAVNSFPTISNISICVASKKCID